MGQEPGADPPAPASLSERGQYILRWAERLHCSVLADAFRLTANGKHGVTATQALFQVCDMIGLICKTPL